MNTLKTVFGKLFKEETQLASHEVKLNTINELKQAIQKVEGYVSNVEQIKKDLISKNNQLNSEFKVGFKLYSDIKSQAKQLGLDVSNIAELKKLDDLSKQINDISAMIKKIQ
jgi:predicted xylose isomerase-like sugar epimerase